MPPLTPNQKLDPEMEILIRNLVKEEVKNQATTTKFITVPPHEHNGVDNFPINPATGLLGFPTRPGAPTDLAPNGTLVLSDNGSNRYINVRINKNWYAVEVT